jgi:hypothetical protein
MFCLGWVGLGSAAERAPVTTTIFRIDGMKVERSEQNGDVVYSAVFNDDRGDRIECGSMSMRGKSEPVQFCTTHTKDGETDMNQDEARRFFAHFEEAWNAINKTNHDE